METIWNNGIIFIIWLQNLGAWLAGPMQVISFLGTETFALILLPCLFWFAETGLAARVAAIILLSSGFNEAFKLAFHGPRPYWYSTSVRAYAGEVNFGIPSGHSVTATVLFGTAAGLARRPWAWLMAILLIFLVGLSRIYLGVHFPTDVLAGWALGALFVWAFAVGWEPISAWARLCSLAQQIGLALTVSMAIVACGTAFYLPLAGWSMPAEWAVNAQLAGVSVMPDPVSLDNVIAVAGALFGILTGLAWMTSRGGFSPRGSLGQKLLRLVVGLAGVGVLYLALGLTFPKDATLWDYCLRYLSYALLGTWISAGAPWVFINLNLAQPSQTSARNIL